MSQGVEGYWYCPHCGFIYDSPHGLCPNCGATLQRKAKPTYEELEDELERLKAGIRKILENMK